ncbi:MAG TPA: cob(I)yrinic acid a,c-diamide adenosyltransferase [Deltaproteobacteria bacterium]|nr:cob(I)yrinic acid a,c-diamide adenosyltransferase [Deltaproteobacteria bacterium]
MESSLNLSRGDIARGYLHLYTGDGKGKTTAALGLALRAAGHGLRTYIGQFMKGRDCGELRASSLLAPYITIEQYGKGYFVVNEDPPRDDDVQRAKGGLAQAKSALLSGKYDIVVLDEIINAYTFHLVTLQEMLELADARPAGVELVFTGRNAPPALIEKADLVTEMKEIKHYYRKGVKARRGIEQ